ncbi:OmpA family protein, partial [Nevskia ramosa]
GVPDNLDKCPGTPKGFKVDRDGCIIEQKVTLRSINFEFNKDRLTDPSKLSLNEVATALNAQSALSVQVGGYTDSLGSDAYNQKLSQRRADAVRVYLISQGVPSGQLTAKGFGEANPVGDNATEEGRTENRRVEFTVLNKPASVKVIEKTPTPASKKAAAPKK